jgi:Citrate synthase, C-terminal domain
MDSLRQGNPAAVARADVVGLRTDDAIGALLFHGVSNPSTHPADGEGRREKRDLESQTVQQQRRVELDIRLQPPSQLVFLEQAQRGIDFALAAVARVLRLPSGAPLTLFAMGRTIGWIGHAIEQYANGQLIRPRAKYVGIVPPSR